MSTETLYPALDKIVMETAAQLRRDKAGIVLG